MRNTKNAFTLVELIVVITILAILGTIAFISLQGYSADARNSKRTSDIGNIQSAISLKQVEGVPLMSFVSGTANTIATMPLAGVADTTESYEAGTPSYTVLNVAEKDFKDPQGDQEYRIGATTVQNGVFQITATMEIDGTDTAQVNGTYIARTTASTTSSGTVVAGSLKTIILDDAFANTFKAGDTLSTGSKIQKVSRDGVTLTVDNDETAGSNAYTLALNESLGLVGSTADTSLPVTNLSTTNLPY